MNQSKCRSAPATSEPTTRRRDPSAVAQTACPAPAKSPVASTPGPRYSPADILALQRAVGNRAVQRMLGAAAARPAEQPASSGGLPADLQGQMERSFATDLTSVQIHRDSASAAALGALAYTEGEHIHMAPGQFQPESQAGRELIGHELAHVVQQRQGRAGPGVQTMIPGSGAVLAISADAGLEREAGMMGARAARGQPAMIGQPGASAPHPGRVAQLAAPGPIDHVMNSCFVAAVINIFATVTSLGNLLNPEQNPLADEANDLQGTLYEAVENVNTDQLVPEDDVRRIMAAMRNADVIPDMGSQDLNEVLENTVNALTADNGVTTGQANARVAFGTVNWGGAQTVQQTVTGTYIPAALPNVVHINRVDGNNLAAPKTFVINIGNQHQPQNVTFTLKAIGERDVTNYSESHFISHVERGDAGENWYRSDDVGEEGPEVDDEGVIAHNNALMSSAVTYVYERNAMAAVNPVLAVNFGLDQAALLTSYYNRMFEDRQHLGRRQRFALLKLLQGKDKTKAEQLEGELAKERTANVEEFVKKWLVALEPIMHGAHCEHESVGFVGAATVLAVFLNGQFIPQQIGEYDPEKASKQTQPKPNLKAEPQEPPIEMLKKQIEKYRALVPAMNKVKEAVRAMEDCDSTKQKRALKASKSVKETRENNPSKLLSNFLLQNVGNQYREKAPAKFTKTRDKKFTAKDKLKEQADARAAHLGGGSELAEFNELAAFEEEEGTFGHSEQLLLAGELWHNIINQLLEGFVAPAREGAKKGKLKDLKLPSQNLTIFLNRSPCGACSKYLLLELINFWTRLAQRMGMEITWQEAMQMFGEFFTFKIAFTSIYHDGSYALAAAALPLVGWELVAIQGFTPEQRKGSSSGSVEITPVSEKELEKVRQAIAEEEEKEDAFNQFSKSERRKLKAELATMGTREKSKRRRSTGRRGMTDEEFERMLAPSSTPSASEDEGSGSDEHPKKMERRGDKGTPRGRPLTGGRGQSSKRGRKQPTRVLASSSQGRDESMSSSSEEQDEHSSRGRGRGSRDSD